MGPLSDENKLQVDEKSNKHSKIQKVSKTNNIENFN